MGDNVCELCKMEESKYQCPNCNILYCSVACFSAKDHIQCSERFYEKCVRDELMTQTVDDESKKKMMEILSRLHHDNEFTDSDVDSDDGSESDLCERLKYIDLDDYDEVWQKLSSEERKEFHESIRDGSITNILPDWQPWWKIHKGRKFISEVGSESIMNVVYPQIQLNIPPLDQLTMKPPAWNIPFMLSNILLSYAYTTKWFKGSHGEMPVEGVSALISLSSVLRDNALFKNMVESFVAFQKDITTCEWTKNVDVDGEGACEDVSDIVNESREGDVCFCVKASLSDIHWMLEKAIELCRNDSGLQTRFTGLPPTVKEMKLLLKKIQYYLSWTASYGMQLKEAWAKFG